MCSELAEHTYTVNRFLALQPFHIVPHRLSQCQLVSEYSEGLTPSDSWHTQGLPPQGIHTHTQTQTSALNSPLSFRHRLPWWHQSACWHGDPSITKSGHLGSPEHPTGSVLRVFNAYVCVCARGCLSGTFPNLVALCHNYPRSTWAACLLPPFLLLLNSSFHSF